jgi:transglutaminase-like putative cysteine protease
MWHTEIFALVVILLAPSITVETVARTSTGQPRKDRAFEVECLTLVPPLPAGARKLRVWVPVPQSGDHQQISNLKIQSPTPYRIYQEPRFSDRYAYLELTPAKVAAPNEIRMSFNATRQEYRADLADPPASGAQPSGKANPESLARWLQPDRLVPTDGMIGELSKEHTKGLNQPLEKARAIYNYVVSTMAYDKSGQGWGRGDAVFACTARKGNCTDFHALFIGMARAAGIPAKFEIGLPLPADKTSGEIPGYHCWALFYLEGTGWVPVDASEAWKNPARREYYFGAFDPDRVLFAQGRDIRLSPPQAGDPLNYFVYPYAELDGKPLELAHKFSFHDLPPQ